MTLSEIHDNKLYQIATWFYCYLWVVWHPVSAALCQPCPALPASAVLCCLFPAVELSWFAEPVFPVVCTYPDSPDPSCPLAGSCRMVELLPVGLSWTASVGFSRGMVGREWSGWGWNYLRVEGWRSQITQQFSQILDTRLLQTVLALQAGLWSLYGRLDVSFTSARTWQD